MVWYDTIQASLDPPRMLSYHSWLKSDSTIAFRMGIYAILLPHHCDILRYRHLAILPFSQVPSYRALISISESSCITHGPGSFRTCPEALLRPWTPIKGYWATGAQLNHQQGGDDERARMRQKTIYELDSTEALDVDTEPTFFVAAFSATDDNPGSSDDGSVVAAKKGLPKRDCYIME